MNKTYGWAGKILLDLTVFPPAKVAKRENFILPLVHMADFDSTDFYYENLLQLSALEQNIISIHRKKFASPVSKKQETFLWITIRPGDCSTATFLECVDRLMNKKWIKQNDYLYVIEQSKDPSYYVGRTNFKDNGKHIHLLLLAKKRKSEVVREIHSTFKHIMTKSGIDVKVMIKKFLDDKKEYILGLKTGEGKAEHQAGDIIYRKNKNLCIYYTNASSFTKTQTQSA